MPVWSDYLKNISFDYQQKYDMDVAKLKNCYQIENDQGSRCHDTSLKMYSIKVN